MSWIDREIRKRAAETRASALDATRSEFDGESESARMLDLWARFRGVNNALPDEIQLQLDHARPASGSSEDARVVEWLRARNGAALGSAGMALRYAWPERSTRKSQNFWIRWSVQKKCYVVIQRISATLPPTFAEFKFNENKAEHIVKCLVLGQRVKPSAVRKRRFWLF